MVDRIAELKLGAKLVENDMLETSVPKNNNIQFMFFSKIEEVIKDLKSVNADNTNDYETSKKQLIMIKQKIILLENESVPQHYVKNKINLINLVKENLKEKIIAINNKKLLENEKNKNQAIRKILLISPNISPENLEIALKYPDEYMKESVYSSTFDPEIILKKVLTNCKTQHSEIIKLENQIKELNEIYLDFAVVVEKQGEHLNLIEENLLLTNDYIDDANENLKESIYIKQKIIKKKCCLFLIFLIILAVVIAIIVSISYNNNK